MFSPFLAVALTRHSFIPVILEIIMSTTFKYSGERKSHQSLNEVYFRTSAIKDWKHLLKDDK
jgi:hypothetical protein